MKITQIKNLITARLNNGSNSVAKERELWNIILNECIKLYEVKSIRVNLLLSPTYMVDNFDNTGLGIGSMDGFAICNGNNNTANFSGRTEIGYGEGYATIGAIGGSKDSVVVEHSHKYTQYSLDQEVSRNGSGVRALNKNNSQDSEVVFTTDITGQSGADKNMPPYIVTLKIQRIS